MCDEIRYEPTSAQVKAFRQLVAALKACSQAGLYVWDDYGTISAVNGLVVKWVAPEEYNRDNLLALDRDQVLTIHTSCWRGSNADDTLYVELK